jgi:hypothetical protein
VTVYSLERNAQEGAGGGGCLLLLLAVPAAIGMIFIAVRAGTVWFATRFIADLPEAFADTFAGAVTAGIIAGAVWLKKKVDAK